jgi:hypothetical protein
MAKSKLERTESVRLAFGVHPGKEALAMAAVQCKGESLDNSPAGVSSGGDLQEFKNITNRMMQDALQVWAQLWGELESRVPSEGRELPSAAEKGTSSYEWSEFIEKMWLLRHYLDFTKRLSQQEQQTTHPIYMTNE